MQRAVIVSAMRTPVGSGWLLAVTLWRLAFGCQVLAVWCRFLALGYAGASIDKDVGMSIALF